MLRTEMHKRVVWVLAAILPPCLVAVMILEYGVDFPIRDEWEMLPLLMKKVHGTLTFSDLFAQVNEYRQLFPNLIFVYLGRLTGWDVRYEMLLSFLTACAVSCNVYLLGRKTLQDGAGRILAFALSNVLIFSTVQYENWFMGQQLIFFVPALCIITCNVISYSNLRVPTKFILCALLSAVSSFSSANGLLCWIVVFPVLVESEIRGETRKPKWLTPLWFAGFASCVSLYFYNFERPPYLPSTSEPFVRPLAAIAYFLAFLGAPLTGNNRYLVPVAALMGLVLATLFISAWFFRARHLNEKGLRRPMTCWLMIAAYSILTAPLVTLGRLGYGVEQSLSSRYTTFSLYLVVSLIHVAVIAGGRTWGDDAKSVRQFPLRLLPFAAAGLIVFYILGTAVSIRATHQWRARIMQGKACLLFVNVLTDACGSPQAMAFPERMRERLNTLDAMGFLRPGLIKSPRARDFAADVARICGSFDQLSRNGDVFVASGRAVLPDREEPADAILLTYTRKDDDPVLFSIAETNYNGDILKSILNRDPDDIFRWQKTFPQGSIPADAVGVSAWAFDSNTGKGCELEGAHSLK